MKTKRSGIATAEEIRRRAEAEAWEPPELVTLPVSGHVLKMRRPRPLAYVLAKHPLPQSIALKVAAAGGIENIDLSKEDQLALLLSQSEILCAAILEPKFALEPQEDELDPRLLPLPDQEFILAWIRGEAASDGSDLAGFRGEPGPAAGGASGGKVRVPPERVAARKND